MPQDSALTAAKPKAEAEGSWQGSLVRFGLGLLFVLATMAYVAWFRDGQASLVLVMAAVFGAYMAMNIGANDVANNVGPAVGSKVLTLGGALVIAAVFEAAGALIAGGEVVGTIRSGIINPALIPDGQTFIWAMMAALLAAAVWLNIASAVGAPISTTHSIVGGVLGAGIAASGMAVVNWPVMGNIAMSWVVSPLMGATIAAGFLYLIKRTITYRQDMVLAARNRVPMLVAVMAWAFATYLLVKGVNKLIPVSFAAAVLLGLAIAAVVYFVSRGAVLRRVGELENSKAGINRLFGLPLVFAAALLSFAHGSNDVANAIGPLAAIVDVVSSDGAINSKAPIPFWVMAIGALGIAVGLALYGPRVIRTVGTEITELDPMRAYCIAMAATLTVILASQLGLPVSTTHVSVGAVFGVGFLREYLKTNYSRIVAEIKSHHPEGDQAALDDFMARFTAATIQERGVMLAKLKQDFKQKQGPDYLEKSERKLLRKAHRKELVKRSLMLRIVAAWIITVPASALLATLLFYMLRGMLLA
jgi:PiT family inorganic phosphate transporter